MLLSLSLLHLILSSSSLFLSSPLHPQSLQLTHTHTHPPLRLCPMLVQFGVCVCVYVLLLVVVLAEEFKQSPLALQFLCCWINETKTVRTLLTLTAIIINFGVASSDIVSLLLYTMTSMFCTLNDNTQ